jgi:hypothetical protein
MVRLVCELISAHLFQDELGLQRRARGGGWTGAMQRTRAAVASPLASEPRRGWSPPTSTPPAFKLPVQGLCKLNKEDQRSALPSGRHADTVFKLPDAVHDSWGRHGVMHAPVRTGVQDTKTR